MRDAQHLSQDDLALYALQALSHDESVTIREHLSECEECRTELARFRGDLAIVALSVDQYSLPSGARERFAQKIGQNPQIAAPKGVPIDHVAKFAVTAWWWSGWVAAALIFVLAVGLGFEVASLTTRLRQRDTRIASLGASESRAKRVDELLTAPEAQRVLLTAPKMPPAPTGRVIYLAATGGLIFQANNISRVPAGKAYELWVIPADGSAPIPAGLFQPDARGNGLVVLPSIPHGVKAKAFGVTLENAAGSKSPTAPILLAGSVPENGA